MPTYCFVAGCKSVFSNENNVKFHIFPKEKTLRQRWIRAIRTKRTLTNHSKVCSVHFKESDYVLSNTGQTKVLMKRSVPSQNLSRRKRGQPKRMPRLPVLNSQSPPSSAKIEVISSDTSFASEIFVNGSSVNVDVDPIKITVPVPNAVSEFAAGSCVGLDVDPIEITIPAPLRSSIESNTGETSPVAEPIRYIESSTQTTTYHEIPTNILVENLSGLEIIYFTGFERNRFNLLYSAINIKSNTYDDRLNSRNQLALTLMKYRRGIDFILIGKLYNLSRQVVSKIFLYWTKAIYTYLKNIDFWKYRHVSSDSYTAIIDCTEIFTERSSLDPSVNQELFSNYKNHNTFKYLVAIDEKGLLIFCSKVYGGSKSDRFIIEDSRFLDLLHSGDIILADTGFNISDILETKNVALNIPPFKTAPQFQPEEVLETRILANRRIHVERVINLTKKNKILSSTIPTSLWPVVNEIVYNANMLCNFKNRVV